MEAANSTEDWSAVPRAGSSPPCSGGSGSFEAQLQWLMAPRSPVSLKALAVSNVHGFLF